MGINILTEQEFRTFHVSRFNDDKPLPLAIYEDNVTCLGQVGDQEAIVSDRNTGNILDSRLFDGPGGYNKNFHVVATDEQKGKMIKQAEKLGAGFIVATHYESAPQGQTPVLGYAFKVNI